LFSIVSDLGKHVERREKSRVARAFLVHLTKMKKTYQTDHKIYQNGIECTKWPQSTKWAYNISKYSFTRPSNVCKNWNFWFESIPSGNPGEKSEKLTRE
jgi:hypothetical protein